MNKINNYLLNILMEYGGKLPDHFYLKLYTMLKTGKNYNLKKPVTFNEKINWIKMYERHPLMTVCADKYKVREYVAKKIGTQYLNPLLWEGTNPNDIPFESLPNSFALKTNNGSGTNIIVTDKKNINRETVIDKLDNWLKIDNYTPKREWVYKNISPRIICEKFLKQENNEELRDYRFFCFNGEPKFISVDIDINNKEKTRRNLYTLDWDLMEEEITYPKETQLALEKPEALDVMIELSRRLSKDFKHVRVDFYYIDKRIIFGEMTFYHQSGTGNIQPEEFNNLMGEWLSLS